MHFNENAIKPRYKMQNLLRNHVKFEKLFKNKLL